MGMYEIRIGECVMKTTSKSSASYIWLQPFQDALAVNDPLKAIQALYVVCREEDRSHPRSKEMKHAIHLLQQYSPELERRWQWGLLLSKHHETFSFGLALLVPFYRFRADDISQLFLSMADDPDWITREEAAALLSELLSYYFDEIYPQCLQWVRDPAENVRRAVAVGMKTAAQARVPEWGELFLDLIDPLMSDRSVYVRKNLGPFAIGDGLLRYYPELTLRRLAQWAQSQDEQVRWNVAMAFSASGGVRYVEAALPILTELAADERRYVWRAAATAMRHLGRRKPEQVGPVLEQWMHDEQRRKSAEVVLKYIENNPKNASASTTKGGKHGLDHEAVVNLLRTSDEIIRKHPEVVFEDSSETLHQLREERLIDLERKRSI
jgi:3-methyladenine DNA glycosylase AlkC